MAKNNVWMSVSDLMTGLMVIFLFVAIAYIQQSEEDYYKLKEFVENRQKLHDKLIDTFKPEIENGVIVIGGDLSMRFQNAETLFESGSWQLSVKFQKQLADILPRYMDILLTDTLRNSIKEIRIEGHTDTVPYPQLDSDKYIANLILSQKRALSVMQYVRSLPMYQGYTEEEKNLLEYWFTANGLSYGHALDKNNKHALLTGRSIDANRSRRVEFRIITSGEEMLDSIVSASTKGILNQR